MEYLEYKPDRRLQPYIECYWSAFSDKPPFREQESLIPDGTIEFMFNFGDNYVQIKEGKREEVKGAHVIGIRKQSLVISQTGRQHFFCIRFRVGGTYPFFKVPVDLFADAFHTMEDLLGNRMKELESALWQATDSRERVRLADGFFLACLDDGIWDYQFVRKCVPAVLGASRPVDVPREFNVTAKTLDRRFRRVLGLSPSELLRIHRFNNAVHAMYSGLHPSLTSIGYACGYYDQSHFIREFKQLTTFTPGEFLKERFTIVQVIQPALAERLSKLYNS